jgi:hypothetical protein
MNDNDKSRGRHNPELETPVKLCRDDKRKLYSLLDAQVQKRLTRLEQGVLALIIMNGSQVLSLFGGPNIPAAIIHGVQGLI